MNDFTWTVRVRTDAKCNTVHARNNAFSVGQPLSFAPTDSLPCAIEVALGALAADLSGTFRKLASRQRITVDALEFSATCRLGNPLVPVGVIGETGNPGIAAIDGTLYVSADADEPVLESIWSDALARSPLYATFGRAAELTVRMQITD